MHPASDNECMHACRAVQKPEHYCRSDAAGGTACCMQMGEGKGSDCRLRSWLRPGGRRRKKVRGGGQGVDLCTYERAS